MCKRLKADHRGSGIITVLVTVVLIAAMGASMLYLSYNAYQIRAADRGSKQNFYDAEGAMNSVRFAMQNVATVAIREAYADVLSAYGTTAVDDRQTAFAKAFVQRLSEYKPSKTYEKDGGGNYPEGVEGDSLIFQNIFDTNAACNLSYLGLFYESPYVALGDRVSVSLTGDRATENWRSVRLKNVTLSYLDKGYETTISTDIVIHVPPFAYVVPGHALSVAHDYVTIADGTMKTNGANAININGDCYFGNINIDSGATLNLNSGTVVCGDTDYDNANGLVKLAGNAKLTGSNALSFWSKRITLGAGAELTLQSQSFVADDLRVDGDNATVTLGDRYYGFGYDRNDPANSSAILINGANTTLNFSGINNLMLAGYGFISGNSYGNVAGSLNLGSSLSFKSDQTVFLAPEELLTNDGGYSGNPFIMPANLSLPAFELDTGTVLPYINETLADYGAEWKVLSWPLPSNNLFRAVYVFLSFPDPAEANRYFADYFSAGENKDRMQTYLQNYLNANSQIEELRIALQAAGGAYAGADGGYELLPPSQSSITNLADSLSVMYRSLSRNLTTSGAAADATPFRTLVDVNMINHGDSEDNFALDPYNGGDSTLYTFSMIDEADEYQKVALIVNNESVGATFTINEPLKGSYPKLALVIATGDVRVSSNFTGLILCGGDLTVDGGVNLQSDALTIPKIFNDADADSEALREGGIPLKLGRYLRLSGGGGGPSDISWDLHTVVTYGNWEKNREAS